jgi:hypothetical protein
MLLWNTIHFAGIGLQIIAAFSGGLVSFWWFKVKNGGIYVSPERAQLTKRLSYILLWVLTVGFLLELFYEIHLL